MPRQTHPMYTRRHILIVVTILGFLAGLEAVFVCAPVMRSSLVGQLLWRLELATYDFRIANSTIDAPSDAITIVAIDQPSIDTSGQWPWSREWHARVIQNLAAAGAAMIGIDIILSTVSARPGVSEAAQWTPLDADPEASPADAALATAIEQAGNVFLAMTISSTRRHGEDQAADMVQATFPYWGFEEGAQGIGVVDMSKDVDGVIRRCEFTYRHQDEQFPTLPVALAAAHGGEQPDALVQRLRSVAPPGFQNSVGDDSFLMSYRGKPGVGFVHIPYPQVLSGRFAPESVRGRIVLIGATAPSLQDLHDTPVGLSRGKQNVPRMSGVEVLANALESLLRERHLQEATTASVAALTLLLAAVTAAAEVRLRPLWALAAVWLPGQLLVFILCVAVWQYQRVWLPMIPLSLGVTLSYVVTTVYLELTTEKQRRHIERSWAQRVSPEVLKLVLDNPGLTQVKGKRIVATVLFTDLQGFTTFCHEAEPEVVVEALNDCLALVTRVVRQHGGTVHKFIGDGVLAVFGDPIHQPDHARRAVLAAIDMQRDMHRLRAERDQTQWEPHLRVGVHTGPLVAGDIGSGEMLEYTVIGDTVSTASRLEGLGKQYARDIIVSDSTRAAAGDGMPVEDLGIAQIRGLSEGLHIFSINALHSTQEEAVK